MRVSTDTPLTIVIVYCTEKVDDILSCESYFGVQIICNSYDLIIYRTIFRLSFFDLPKLINMRMLFSKVMI